MFSIRGPTVYSVIRPRTLAIAVSWAKPARCRSQLRWGMKVLRPNGRWVRDFPA